MHYQTCSVRRAIDISVCKKRRRLTKIKTRLEHILAIAKIFPISQNLKLGVTWMKLKLC